MYCKFIKGTSALVWLALEDFLQKFCKVCVVPYLITLNKYPEINHILATAVQPKFYQCPHYWIPFQTLVPEPRSNPETSVFSDFIGVSNIRIKSGSLSVSRVIHCILSVAQHTRLSKKICSQQYIIPTT